MTTFDEKIAYFENKQKELMQMQTELNNKFAEYRAELKAFCGITDGEQTNVVDILKVIKKVSELLK